MIFVFQHGTGRGARTHASEGGAQVCVKGLRWGAGRSGHITLLTTRFSTQMDTHTKCDPFAVVKLGNVSRKTKVVKKTYNPEWGETFRLSYNESSPPPSELEVEIFDWDKVGGSEFVGRLVLPLGDLGADEDVQGWFDLQGNDGWVVRGHDRNISAVQISVLLQAGLPQVAWWESKPEWILTTARVGMGLWALLGAFIWLRERNLSKQKQS